MRALRRGPCSYLVWGRASEQAAPCASVGLAQGVCRGKPKKQRTRGWAGGGWRAPNSHYWPGLSFGSACGGVTRPRMFLPSRFRRQSTKSHLHHRSFWSVQRTHVPPENPVWPHCPSCSQLQFNFSSHPPIPESLPGAPARQMDIRLYCALSGGQRDLGNQPDTVVLNVLTLTLVGITLVTRHVTCHCH